MKSGRGPANGHSSRNRVFYAVSFAISDFVFLGVGSRTLRLDNITASSIATTEKPMVHQKAEWYASGKALGYKSSVLMTPDPASFRYVQFLPGRVKYGWTGVYENDHE